MIYTLNTVLNALNTTAGVFLGSFIWSMMPLTLIVRNASYRARRSFVRTTFFKVIGIPVFSVYLLWALANTIKEVFWYDIQFSSSLLLFTFIGVLSFCLTHNLKCFKKTKTEKFFKAIGYIVIVMSLFFLYISYKEFINPTCYYNVKRTPEIFVHSIQTAEKMIDSNLKVFEESTTFPKLLMLRTMVVACPFAVYTNLFCTRCLALYVGYFFLIAVVVVFRLIDFVKMIFKRVKTQKPDK